MRTLLLLILEITIQRKKNGDIDAWKVHLLLVWNLENPKRLDNVGKLYQKAQNYWGLG